MNTVNLLIILVGVMGVAGLSALAYVLLGGQGSRATADIRGLMGAGRAASDPMGSRARDLDIEQIKAQTKRDVKTKSGDDLATRLFKAGYYSSEDRRNFARFQMAAPFITTPFCGGFMLYLGNPLLIVAGVVLGVFIGFAWPMSWLERQIRRREEDLMYYLPLVIEQISIGVSSSLDIGPCINQVVSMASERDSHNPVTEMFIHVERLIRSGLNLEDALVEVGETNGMPDVKHCFMFLAQCAKHGGEVSKQLQELADAVTTQRQVAVEARIASLPVKATGPLAVVFAGFFALLLAGLFVRLMGAFG
ncbi:MAG: type II secretion system F family protein [Bdellovibrionales bacterium]|nr:type II secretion system F family protein [Bdellovibrionales bacterium]